MTKNNCIANVLLVIVSDTRWKGKGTWNQTTVSRRQSSVARHKSRGNLFKLTVDILASISSNHERCTQTISHIIKIQLGIILVMNMINETRHAVSKSKTSDKTWIIFLV